MDVSQPTPAESKGRETAAEKGATASADRCPVDHAAGSTPPEAAARPQTVIPATTLPGPQTPQLLQVFTHWKRPVVFMERCRQRYGSRFALSRGFPPRPMYVLTDPEDVKQIFLAPNDVLHTGRSSAMIEKFIGHTGLAWLDEDEHKVRRKLLMPSMHGTALQRLAPLIAEMAARDVARWPRGEVTSLHPFSYRFTLNVIREVIFGSAPPKRWEEFLDTWLTMMRFANRPAALLMYQRMSPAKIRLMKAIRPLGYHAFLKHRAHADALMAEYIEERRNSGEAGDDMLSVLLRITHEDGSPLSDVELRDEMMTIFLAGTETVAGALSWAFLHLSHEPAVCERLLAEIEAGEGDAYLTATVQEVLRVWPSIPQIIAREVMKPIEIGGVRYEPGSFLWASAYLMHHDPAVYPDPDEFRPERWLGTKPGAYSWIPFGGGRIRCLGAEIAILEMKAVLREVLTQCELRPVGPQLEKPRSRVVIVIPRKGARVELRPRSKAPSLTGS
ncbi:cytochrome P450 [Actinomadura scrupuli]|uniref:cytochrome P450 n=1 Tax=Actinomadura scrupuli TaxID=559629 RepID=UPI003D975926